ncbi:hypothetical protein ANTQUA_LOCUS5144 [Anthophora quadrimaculata]
MIFNINIISKSSGNIGCTDCVKSNRVELVDNEQDPEYTERVDNHIDETNNEREARGKTRRFDQMDTGNSTRADLTIEILRSVGEILADVLRAFQSDGR